MTRSLPPLVALALLLLLLGFAPGAVRHGPYEYKFVRVKQGLMANGALQTVPAEELGEQVANTLGPRGWVLDQLDSTWVNDMNGRYEALTLVFRRPLN